jgi:hypothetical protein
MSSGRIILPDSVNLKNVKIHAPTERPVERAPYVSAYQNKELRENFATDEGFALMAHGIDLVEQARHAGAPDQIIQQIIPIARLICHSAPTIDQEMLAANEENLDFAYAKIEGEAAYTIKIGDEESGYTTFIVEADNAANALATAALVLRKTSHQLAFEAAKAGGLVEEGADAPHEMNESP